MQGALGAPIPAPILVVVGAATSSLVSAAWMALESSAGLGPHGWTPRLVAAALSASLGFLLARGVYRLRVRESTPVRMAGVGLAAAGILGLLAAPGARVIGALLVTLSAGKDFPSPGLGPESIALIALTSPWILPAMLAWAAGSPAGAAARLGFVLLGAGGGVILDGAGWVKLTGGHPIVPSLLLLASAALLLSPGRRAAAEAAATEERQEGGATETWIEGREGRAALALVFSVAGLGGVILAGGLVRLALLVAGPERVPAAAALMLLACAGAGALAAPGALRRRGGPWRPLAFFLGITGLMGLAAAVLGDRLPSAYLEVLGRYGFGQGGEMAATAAVVAVATVGFALCAGAAAGAAASMERGAFTALALASSAIGFISLPRLLGAVGARGVILVGSSALLLSGAFAWLLIRGPLARRAFRAIALLLAGGALLISGESWDLRRFLPAPSQNPDRYLALGSAIIQRRTGRDRVLAYGDGPRSSAGILLLDGQIPAAFMDGRARATGGHDADRSLGFAGHLPFLLGGAAKRILVLGPLLSGTWEAMSLHAPHDVDLVAPDAQGALLLLTSHEALLPGGGRKVTAPRIIPGDMRRTLSGRAGAWERIVIPPGVDPDLLAEILDPASLTLMKAALTPGGILLVSLPLDGLDINALRAAAGAFESRFPGSRAWLTRGDLILAGGAGPLVPDLGRMGAVSRQPAVAGSLAAIGLEDPLRILALQIETARLAEGSGPDLAESIRRGASAARLSPVALENLRALLDAHAAAVPSVKIPAFFADEARRSVAMRIQVLRTAMRLVMSSRVAWLAGDGAAAHAAAAEALSRDPSDVEARYLLARGIVERATASLAEGDVAGARMGYAEALDLYPASVHALGDLAWIRYADGDRAGAEQLLRRAARIAPWIAQTHYRLGLLRYEAGDIAGAMGSLNEAHWLDPLQPEPLLLMGDMARLEGDTERARRLYESALETGARTAEIRAALAAATLEDGEIDRGLEEIEAALREKPGDPEALMTRARIRIRRGEPEAARRDLLAAVATGGAPYRARALLEPAFREVLLGEKGPRE